MSANPTTIKGQDSCRASSRGRWRTTTTASDCSTTHSRRSATPVWSWVDDVEVVFHQNAPDRVRFVLPSRPRSDRDLEPSEFGAAALSEYNAALL